MYFKHACLYVEANCRAGRDKNLFSLLTLFGIHFSFFFTNISFIDKDMFAVRTHYKLIDVLPNALAFCTWMQIAMRSLKNIAKCNHTTIQTSMNLPQFEDALSTFIDTNPFGISSPPYPPLLLLTLLSPPPYPPLLFILSFLFPLLLIQNSMNLPIQRRPEHFHRHLIHLVPPSPLRTLIYSTTCTIIYRIFIGPS